MPGPAVTLTESCEEPYPIRFDRALRRRAPRLSTRIEEDADQAFLKALFVACAPLRTILPPVLLDMQASAQHSAHRAAFPQAMRAILLDGIEPIGRIVIDRRPGSSHLVDIAILPEARANGGGLAMLRGWIALADADGDTCSLQVLRDNPAIALYRRLGFAPLEDDGIAPTLAMMRAPAAASR